MPNAGKTVVVLGMHRSGTSMTTGILKELGVFVGWKLVGRMRSNPLGHFEDKEFVELNDRILKAAGGDSFHPPEPKAILAQQVAFEADLRGLIRTRNHEIWGWKDPRTCLTMELYLPYLENPYFIVCHREAAAVAESLRKRNGLEPVEGVKLKKEYDARIEGFFARHPTLNRLDLDYRASADDPEGFVREIVDFLGMKVDEDKIRRAAEVVLPPAELVRVGQAVGRRTAISEGLKRLERSIRRWRKRTFRVGDIAK